MNLTVNGRPCEIPDGQTVASALSDLGLSDPKGVAVAVDAEIIPAGQWQALVLRPGQRVEILRAVQGG